MDTGKKLTPAQLAVLARSFDAGLDRCRRVLSTLPGPKLSLDLQGEITSFTGEVRPFDDQAQAAACQVQLPFSGPLTGEVAFTLDRLEACRLIALLTARSVAEGSIDTLEAGTIRELGSIIMDGITNSLCRDLGIGLVFQVPTFRQGVFPPGSRAVSASESCHLTGGLNLKVSGWTARGLVRFSINGESRHALENRLDALVGVVV